MLWIFLWIAWVIFNGKFTIEIAIFGAGFATLLYFFTCKALGYSAKMDAVVFKSFGRILKYFAILIWEIVKANIGVLKFVLKPGAKIEPRLVFFKTNLKSDISKAALANSITITPGTITVEVEEDVFCVHAFDKSMAEGLGDSVFVKQLEQMEKACKAGEKEDK